MIKKIAVVNFNMIMCNIIRLYADKVSIKDHPSISWKRIQVEMHLDPLKDLRYDAVVLNRIAEFISKSVKKGATLKTYDSILDYTELMDVVNNDTVYNIDNISFFSGLVKDKDLAEKEQPNEMNWLLYLFERSSVGDESSWVRSYSSDTRPIPVEFGNKNFSNFKTDYKYDEVIFIFDPLFVPEEYRHIYELIVDINRVYKRG